MGCSIPAGRLRPAVRVGGASLLAALLVAPGLGAPSANAQSRGAQSPEQTETIVILDNSSANPYPSRLTVEDVPGTIDDVNLILFDIEHTNPDDIDILLVGPTGEAVVVLSDVGGAFNVDNVNITIDDQAAGLAPAEGPLESDSYRVTNTDTVDDNFGAPAPDPNGESMARFNTIDPNGQWRLYVRDDESNDADGFITRGWALRIQTSNTDPVAVDDRYQTDENEDLRVSRGKGLLANDRDADDDGDGDEDDKLTVTGVSQKPRKGRVEVKANGSFRYKPKRNETGADSFVYTISDGKGGQDQGRVSITIK